MKAIPPESNPTLTPCFLASFSLLLGYYNRNRNQEVDIPVGPNNRVEPGGPDRGQPTHFTPGRAWGLFAVKVPADFGQNKITGPWWPTARRL